MNPLLEGARPAHHGESEGGETPPLQTGAEEAGGETPPLHKGWYVPRRLPHFDAPETWQAVTFRLADALPRDVLIARAGDGDTTYRRKVAALLDAGHGACLLRDSGAAAIIEDALIHGAGRRYDLHAWVIMPNHVHVLIAPFDGHALAGIVQAWKSWSAKSINRVRRGSGVVWQRDYFDRYMRDQPHADATIHYIEQNPVAAGLVKQAREWRFGSAWRRANGGFGSPGQ